MDSKSHLADKWPIEGPDTRMNQKRGWGLFPNHFNNWFLHSVCLGAKLILFTLTGEEQFPYLPLAHTLLLGLAWNLFGDCWKTICLTVYLHSKSPVADWVQRPPPSPPPTLKLNRHDGGARRAQYIHRLICTFDVVQQETRAVSVSVSSFVAECCCFS